MVLWMMGSLKDRTPADLYFAAPLTLAGIALLVTAARGLDALTLGEEAAQSLGVDVHAIRRRVVVGVALATGAATAAAGAVSFVGLVVPHLLRPFYGYEPARLILPSALGGAALVAAADVAVRLIAPDGQLLLGVLTAMLGAPFFIWLILRHAEGRMSAALSFEGVRVRYGTRRALHDRVAGARCPARSPALSAPTAPARRRLLRTALALLKPDAGTRAPVRPAACPIGRTRRGRAAIAYLPQATETHWPLIARRVVALGRMPHRASFRAAFAPPTGPPSMTRSRAAMRAHSRIAAWTKSRPASGRACCSPARWPRPRRSSWSTSPPPISIPPINCS